MLPYYIVIPTERQYINVSEFLLFFDYFITCFLPQTGIMIDMKEFWRTSSKIMVAVMLCASLLAASIGGVVLYQSSSVIERNTYKNLEIMAEDYANIFSKSTEHVETTLNAYVTSISATLDMGSLRRDPDAYLKNYRDDTLAPLTKQFAVDNKNSILGVYFDFDPGIPKNLKAEDQTYGVWYLDKKLNGSIERNDMEFKKNFYPDNASMSWYYNAVNAKKGVWSKPYVDIYTGYYMISYNVPLYYGQQLIGVAGIDMTFESVKSMIEKFKVLDTGYSFLLSSDYDIIVSPTSKQLDENIKLTDLNPDYQKLIDVIKNDKDKNVRIGKSYDAKFLSYGKMTNGYIFVIEVKSDEIFKDLNHVRMLVDIMILIGIIICAAVAYFLGRYIARPVEAAQRKIRRLSSMDLQSDSAGTALKHNKEGQKMLEDIELVRKTAERFLFAFKENIEQEEITQEKMEETIGRLDIILSRMRQNQRPDSENDRFTEFQEGESRKLMGEIEQLLSKLKTIHNKNKKLGNVYYIDENPNEANADNTKDKDGGTK